MARRVATVFGGSGFIGRHLVRRLAAQGWRVRVAVRDPVAAEFLKPMGDVEQIVPIIADVNHPASIKAAIGDSQVVVNLVGILYERFSATFQKVHVEGARNVAEAARAAGARLIHVSALGADRNSESAYGRSKAQGEEAVRFAMADAAILRPSVLFGPEDQFFNKFANLALISPVLPVITGDGFKARLTAEGPEINLYGSGGTHFQPVYVGDVADAIMAIINDTTGETRGKTYELGGPRQYSMKELMELVQKVIDRKRWLIPLPFCIAGFQAKFLQYWFKPVLTPDQVKLLRKDNVVSGDLPGLEALGVSPTAAEGILPQYLSRYRPLEDLPGLRR